MKLNDNDIEEILRHSLRSAPKEQMEAAVDRVFVRLKLDRGETPLLREVPMERPGGFGRLWIPGITAAAVLVVTAAIGLRVEPRRPNGVAGAETIDGSKYLATGRPLRADAGKNVMVSVPDGSRIEMRSDSELSLERADDGVKIRLSAGSIIVSAAKQPTGHLYVQTKDMTVSVVGTIFLVNADTEGSRVAVIEGEVRVRDPQNKIDARLHPGEQLSTTPTLVAHSVKEEIAWSRDADAHVAILEAFTKGMTATAGPLAPLASRNSLVTAGIGQRGAATDSRPEFDEASIRPCDPDNLPPTPQGARGGGPNSFQMTPGRTHALCMTLATLIRTAYGYGPMDLERMNTTDGPGRQGRGMNFNAVYGLGVEDGQRVRGGPDWMRSDRYTIEAVGDGTADARTMRGPMLQALLERRFQLKVHVESEQVPGFALIVASGGLKITPMYDGDCDREPLSDAVKAERERHGWNGPVLITEAAHFGIKPTCGTFYGEQNGPNFRTELVAQSPGAVAFNVGAALDARVVDRTGITDRFIFAWEFGPDESTPGIVGLMPQPKTWVPKPGWDAPPTAPKAPSIFIALEQQLGLEVDPIWVPREFIVIDHVERPSPQ
jgi:uncharacterized protein (TIGR03435 family)